LTLRASGWAGGGHRIFSCIHSKDPVDPKKRRVEGWILSLVTITYYLGSVLLCITNDNQLINWYSKNKLILWKLNSTQMKILNNNACTLNYWNLI
jgi:hypothetical protein